VDGDTVYVATMDGRLRAIDLNSTNELWDEPFNADAGAIAELSFVSDTHLFVATLGKEVFLVDRATGEQIGRSIPADGWIWTRPAIDGSIVYYGDFEGSLFALDITSQQTTWRAETDGRVKASPAIVGDWVIFADESPAVSFVSRESGQVRNRVPISDAGEIRANVVARDGVAYVVTTEGRLFRADPSNFSVVEIPIVGAS
jgi:outer membrane protein assembly factor BamB